MPGQDQRANNDTISCSTLLEKIRTAKRCRIKVVHLLISGIIICIVLLYSSIIQVASNPTRQILFFNKKFVNKLDEINSHQNDEEDLYSKVRIFCWVTTQPVNIEERAVAVWKTWGKRCNKVVFITSQPTDLVPAVVVNTPEGRHHLMAKTAAACRYIYEHHLNDYDWFFKADDDTYLIVENLRYFLSKFMVNHLTYYGYLFKTIVKQGYYSGGSGFAVSREGMKRVVEDGFNKGKCEEDGIGSDHKLGECLQSVGVMTGDSRDAIGRERFHPLPYIDHLMGIYPEWMYEYAKYPVVKGVECCSDISIAFHYVTPQEMYLLDYALYHLQTHGFHKTSSIDLNKPLEPISLLANASDSSTAGSQPP